MWALISPYLTPTVIKWTAIILAVLGLYLYVGHLRSENDRLTKDNATLQVAVQQQQEAIKQLQADHAAIVKAKDELSAKIDELKKQSDELQDTLYREHKGKKSLEELARKKTKLIENLVNKGTEKVFKCFETLSEGASC